MNKRSTSFKVFQNYKFWIGIVLSIVFFIWWGIPTVNKWQADKMVDELCARDGGTKVYEAIKLPAEKIDAYWITNLPSIENAKVDADYYGVSSRIDIRGDSSSAHINDLVVWRNESDIVHAVDKKVMARLVSYIRSGGDPIGPWHPSHYRCPKNGFSPNVFVNP